MNKEEKNELPLFLRNPDIGKEDELAWAILNSKLVEFTNLFSKLGLEYEVKFFGDVKGMMIIIDECIISFHLPGAINFFKKEEEDE